MAPEFILDRIKDNPKIQPKEIIAGIKREYGATISYSKALRGKTMAAAVHSGDFDKNYAVINEYCRQLKKSNPHSIAFA